MKFNYSSVPNVQCFNRILDNEARAQYESAIKDLFALVPKMMARKIPEANIQQAFVLDTVHSFAKDLKSPKILCVGSFEDTAAAGLKKLGYKMKEIDPAINYDLDKFFHRFFTRKNHYDIVFSTSVIEHVEDDERFVSQIAELLAPGGVAVLTADYNDQYKPGDRIPREDVRFYTQRDFRDRLLPLMKECATVDEPQWDCLEPDFIYDDCHYTFATLVVKKNSA